MIINIILTITFRSNISKIDDIFITLDTHHKEHIAFSQFWINNSGEHPKPYMIISNNDVIEKKWYPVDMNLYEYCQSYTKQLEAKGRFQLVIWPDHCILGSVGHEITNRLQSALYKWNKEHENKRIRYIKKGK
jgi:nicotinamidase/pyrazinamidase